MAEGGDLDQSSSTDQDRAVITTQTLLGGTADDALPGILASEMLRSLLGKGEHRRDLLLSLALARADGRYPQSIREQKQLVGGVLDMLAEVGVL